MRSNNIRRASIVAGLALVPALAFGAAAQASPAAEQAPAPAPAEVAHPGPTLKQRGVISELETKNVHGHAVTVFRIDSPAGHSVQWVVTPRTAVIKDGKPVSASELAEGQTVTATGQGHPGHDVAVAREVVID